MELWEGACCIGTLLNVENVGEAPGVDEELPLANPGVAYGPGAAAGGGALLYDVLPEYQLLLVASVFDVEPPPVCVLSPAFDQSVVSSCDGVPQSHSDEAAVEAAGAGVFP